MRRYGGGGDIPKPLSCGGEGEQGGIGSPVSRGTVNVLAGLLQSSGPPTHIDYVRYRTSLREQWFQACNQLKVSTRNLLYLLITLQHQYESLCWGENWLLNFLALAWVRHGLWKPCVYQRREPKRFYGGTTWTGDLKCSEVKIGFWSERDECKPVLLRLSLAGNWKNHLCPSMGPNGGGRDRGPWLWTQGWSMEAENYYLL
jgi:hypothetical protein